MAEQVIDLVCGMILNKDNACNTFEYKGKTYYFCNSRCRDKFVKAPLRYINYEEVKYYPGK